MFGHWFEILMLLFVALLVFGPKKMMEMGSSFGKAFREFREATKDMNWSNLMSTGSTEEPPRPPQAHPTSPRWTTPESATGGTGAARSEPEGVVESTIEHVQHVEEPTRAEP
jgi:TatA/E family protein of Tat protein translocase